MRKRDPQSPGDDRPKPAPSSGGEPLPKEEELDAGSGGSPKTLAWPSPESEQVRGAALNLGPNPPRLLPTEQRRKPKETSPPQGRGALRDRNRDVVGDQQKPTLSSGGETFLTDEELAARWRVASKTLRNARVAGRLIGFVKIGRSVRYRLSDVIAFEKQNFVRSTFGAEE